MDDVAERARALGGRAAGSLSAYLKLTQLTEDDGKTVGEKSMIKDLLAGHETIIRRLRKEADLVGDKFHDVGTNDFITGVIEAHEKMAWMLRSYLA